MDNSEIIAIVIGVLSILFGILVIVQPKILAYLIGIYFIIVGVLGIVRAFF
jgi:uncharacterized membrane protein HdeD (DUF308 family)